MKLQASEQLVSLLFPGIPGLSQFMCALSVMDCSKQNKSTELSEILPTLLCCWTAPCLHTFVLRDQMRDKKWCKPNKASRSLLKMIPGSPCRTLFWRYITAEECPREPFSLNIPAICLPLAIYAVNHHSLCFRVQYFCDKAALILFSSQQRGGNAYFVISPTLPL